MQELYARPGGESLASRRKEAARTGPAVSGDLFSFEGLLSDIGTGTYSACLEGATAHFWFAFWLYHY